MLLYMYVDSSQLEDEEYERIQEAVHTPLYEWVQASKHPIHFVGPASTETVNDSEVINANVTFITSEANLGIQINIKKKLHLKDPLNYLYSLAKQARCEFVVGLIEEDGAHEDVCYFGFEEGQPDLYEMASYVGLK